MKTYKATFTGRQKNAIGIFHSVETMLEAVDEKEAELMLYGEYEHISGLSLSVVDPLTPATEAEEIRRGELLAEVLNLRKNKEDGRYMTEWGTKTALGLFRTVERIIKVGR